MLYQRVVVRLLESELLKMRGSQIVIVRQQAIFFLLYRHIQNVAAIPNSKRVYAVSDDRVSLIDLNFNDRAMVPASKISEFGIAAEVVSGWWMVDGRSHIPLVQAIEK